MDSYQDLSESPIQTHRSPPQVLEECASDLLSPWVPGLLDRLCINFFVVDDYCIESISFHQFLVN